MTPDRWRQIDRLLEAALERPSEQRAAFLAEACAGDQELRQEVEELLRSNDRARSFMEEPAVDLAGQVLAANQAERLLGQHLAQYEILSLIGAGGKGEVYLALDTRLKRKVALKLLPPRFTQDADRLRRFEREAQAVSAL